MKLKKAIVALVVILCFSITCIGYASVTDELTIGGVVTYTPPPKTIDYLYVSSASIVNKGANDIIIGMDGSADYLNQRGWVSLTLDFTNATERTVEIELTNLSIANLAFYALECSNATATVDPADLIAGNYNSDTALVEVQEEYISENEANQQTNACIIVGNGGKRSSITVTVSSDAGAVVSGIMLSFLYAPFTKAAQEDIIGGAAIESALEKLKAALNNPFAQDFTNNGHDGKTFYNAIIDEMSLNGQAPWGEDYVGNVIGAVGETDSDLIKDIFGDTLNAISLGGEEAKECTVMLKHEDLTHANTERFERYWFTQRAVNPIEEMTLYMTTTDPGTVNDGAKIPVWAVVFYKDRTTGNWSQYGDIYKGTATTNDYYGGSGNNSFDTGTWRSDGEQAFAVIMDNGTKPTYTVANNVDIRTAIRAYEAVSGTNQHYNQAVPEDT